MKSFIHGILSLSLFFFSSVFCFDTLQHAQRYAESMPEYPSADNEDWLNPDYSSFHKNNIPSFFSRAAQFFGIKKPLWSVSDLKQQIEHITQRREVSSLSGRFIQKMTPAPSTRFFIWGNLHGAFHSLVRELTHLHEEKIIDDHLVITSPNCFFIFNGNVIDRSAYTLETLSLIITLMEKNPEKVIYIRGNHEDKQEWHNYNLKQELKIRASTLSNEQIPLGRETDSFFNTLPLALYLIGQITPKQVSMVRISYHGRQLNELNEQSFASFLTAPQQNRNVSESFRIDTTDMHDSNQTGQKIEIETIIKGETDDTLSSLSVNRGIKSLLPDNGSTAWLVFSSPTSSSQHLYNFFNDAYALLTVSGPIKQWTLTLYGQDARELSRIRDIESYYAVSGISAYTFSKEDAYKIVNKKPIMLGSTMDLSKGVRILSERMRSGLYACFNEINQQGGIEGRLINLSILDDGYSLAVAVENVHKLLQEGISILTSTTGSPTVQAFLDLVYEKKIAIFFHATGAPIFRRRELTNMVNFRPSYPAEAYALTEYAVKTLQARSIAFFYQNDAFGLGGLYGGRIAAKDLKVEKVIEIPYSRNDVSFGKQIEIIKNSNPDALCFFATSIASQQLILQMGIQSLTSTRLLGFSDWGEDVFKSFLKEKGLAYVIVNAVPNPVTSKLPIVREFQEKVKQGIVKPDPFALEGYINASLFVELLKATGGDDSHQALISQAESITNKNFKGLILNFNPETRELSHTFWIDDGKEEWKEHPAKSIDLSDYFKQFGLQNEKVPSIDEEGRETAERDT